MLAWSQTNFCNDFICRNRNIARSLRRNGKCGFSTRLYFHWPNSQRSRLPRSRIATGYDLSPLVTIFSTRPCRFSALFMKRSAADLSRFFVMKRCGALNRPITAEIFQLSAHAVNHSPAYRATRQHRYLRDPRLVPFTAHP